MNIFPASRAFAFKTIDISWLKHRHGIRVLECEFTWLLPFVVPNSEKKRTYHRDDRSVSNANESSSGMQRNLNSRGNHVLLIPDYTTWYTDACADRYDVLFTRKVFATNSTISEIIKIRRTTYHLQTKELAKRNDRIIIIRHRNYVASNQRNWNTFPQLFTYVYNWGLYKYSDIPPFTLVLSRHQPESTVASRTSAPTNKKYVEEFPRSSRFLS